MNDKDRMIASPRTHIKQHIHNLVRYLVLAFQTWVS